MRRRRGARDRHDRSRHRRSARTSPAPAGAHPRIVGVKALVTGCAGFIGSTLAERLLAQGATVVGLDCFTDYYPRAIKEQNLSALRANQSFTFVDSRIQDADLAQLLADRTHVFHLAAQA